MRHCPLSSLVVVVACLLAAPMGCGTTAAISAPRESAVEPVSVAGLRWTPQPGWEPRPPTSASRVAQYELPGGASGLPAELVIYYFGPGAGSIEANLDRWCDQFEQPGGGSSRDVARIDHLDVAGLALHLIDVSGTYVAETSPGSGERVNAPDRRLLAAIVETDAGPYYAKLVGRADVVERWEPSFTDFLESLQPAP